MRYILIVTTLFTSISVHAQWIECTNQTGNPQTCTNTGKVGIGTSTPGHLLHVNGATSAPASSQVRISAAGSGGVAVLAYMADNNTLSFDTDWDGFWVARSSSVAWIYKSAGKFAIYGSAGNPIGGNAEQRLYTSIDLTNGNYGIGIVQPAEKLDVVGNAKVSGNITSGGNITATGTINAGTINAKYQDVAEWVPTADDLGPGTVVNIDPAAHNHVTRSAGAYSTTVAGVVSPQPGISLGEAGPNKALIATTGRVKLKVEAIKNAIQIGDLLTTSDLPGHAMKSILVNVGGVQLLRPGTIIGKALEPLASGRGEILALLTLQ